MVRLGKESLVNAASDSSDGVLGAVANLAYSSKLAALLDLDKIAVPPATRLAAERAGCDPLNVMLLWGGWEVVAAIPANKLARARVLDGSLTVLGQFDSGPPALYNRINGRRLPLPLLRNENFTQDAYNQSFAAHLRRMLYTPLR
jgi:thiamine-monophosphate kinase